MQDDRSDALRILENELGRNQSIIAGLFGSEGRWLGFGGVVIGATISVALAGHPEAWIGLPFALFAILLYWKRLSIELASRGGYQAYLEESVNAEVGRPVVLWESKIAKKLGHDLNTNKAFTTIVLVVFLVSWVAAFVATVTDDFTQMTQSGAHELRVGLGWFLGVSFVISMVALAVVFKESWDAFDKAKDLAKRATSSGPPID